MKGHTPHAALICLLGTAAMLAAGGAPRHPTPFRVFKSAIQRVVRTYGHHDRNRDGDAEIASLRLLGATAGRGAGGVVVLVERRLIESPTAEPPGDLIRSLKTYAGDLSREGYHVATVSAEVYSGPRHQDGLTVLALRDTLQAVWKRVPDLRAAVLVGNFPTAFIVRQYYWPREDGLVLHAGREYERKWQAVRHVRSIPEPVASPADIVLADLDGNWDRLYHLGPERLAALQAAFPDDPERRATDAYEYSAWRYEDFFFVQDGFWEEEALEGGKRRFTFPGEPNNECTDLDRQLVNVMARPEISIGRINAFHAAMEPNPAVRGIRGETLLDAQGRPQAVEFADERSVPSIEQLWVRSERLERRLLREYFERNHAYRTAATSSAWLPASITTEWGSSVPEMKASVPGWSSVPSGMLDVRGARVSALDFVTWLSKPALARAVKAHAGPTGFGFEAPASTEAYQQALGHYWWWNRQGKRLVPTPAPQGGWIHYGVLRSLYENKKLSGAPALYFHTGCEVMTPAYYEREPYNGPRHGLWQIAEAMLMFGDGLALVGRGKVFYDEPREFWKAMACGETFGDAWRHYFDVESADAELAKDGIGRKRAYFWSVIGDCTVRLPAVLRQPTSDLRQDSARR